MCFSRRGRVAALLAAIVTIGATNGWSETFRLPTRGDSVVGESRYTRASRSETLLDIARSFDLGYTQIIRANPGVNRWLPEDGVQALLPSAYILPTAPREGIVINVAEYRLYYYPPRSGTVETFPISIGRLDWNTPLGTMRVAQKVTNPAWRPPRSIREEAMEEGEELPESVPGGSPDNPLGRYALKLNRSGYLIHGVDERKSFGIGMQVTHGCIRMYPEDIEQLFRQVPIGTPVRVVDQPVKLGWSDGVLYLQIHRPIEPEDRDPMARYSLDDVLRLIASTRGAPEYIDEPYIGEIFDYGSGVPTRIEADGADAEGAMPEREEHSPLAPRDLMSMHPAPRERDGDPRALLALPRSHEYY